MKIRILKKKLKKLWGKHNVYIKIAPFDYEVPHHILMAGVPGYNQYLISNKLLIIKKL